MFIVFSEREASAARSFSVSGAGSRAGGCVVIISRRSFSPEVNILGWVVVVLGGLMVRLLKGLGSWN